MLKFTLTSSPKKYCPVSSKSFVK